MDEAMMKALLEYGLTIQQKGWKAGEPLITKYEKQFKGFQHWAHALGVTLRAYEIIDTKDNSSFIGTMFLIEEPDAQKVRKWQNEHPCKIRGQYQGAIGGAFTFTFTDTSIGQIQIVKCGCGSKLMISDDL